ncbi:hypothetical protein KCV87_31620 [Actinosynnema pretiosum subsp. pretiosum]|uniref:Uncharacterized protein n=1 Tax=Actinosynnema pretiosum subsp. pretiosum TaxID=103721 RepID=A0AA45L6B2_9PSEU|nr:hypothetical protein APASM_4815 [Actinosynnema pretiosum subsp. pretiosum]QUF03863.1 hypothetical protein KCV87_31620 [Actinosynnema pretiosum subsp. pretiosum]
MVFALTFVPLVSNSVEIVQRNGGEWLPAVLVVVCSAYYLDRRMRGIAEWYEQWPDKPSTSRGGIGRAAVRLRERATMWPDWRSPRSRLHQQQAVLVYLELAEAKLALISRRDCRWWRWCAGAHGVLPIASAGAAAGVTALVVTAGVLNGGSFRGRPFLVVGNHRPGVRSRGRVRDLLGTSRRTTR